MHNRRVVVSRLGILDSYHSQGQPRSLHTNDISAQSDWLSLGQPTGMSVISRGSSHDGFPSSDVEEFRAAFL